MRVFRKILFIVASTCCVLLTLYNVDNVPISTNGTIYIVPEYSDTYYEMLSDNVGLTTINGISNVYVNMQKEGYKVYKEDASNSYIDVSFIKEDNPSYRFYFEHPSGRITFFSSDYENSYNGYSYIIDRKE